MPPCQTYFFMFLHFHSFLSILHCPSPPLSFIPLLFLRKKQERDKEGNDLFFTHSCWRRVLKNDENLLKPCFATGKRSKTASETLESQGFNDDNHLLLTFKTSLTIIRSKQESAHKFNNNTRKSLSIKNDTQSSFLDNLQTLNFL